MDAVDFGIDQLSPGEENSFRGARSSCVTVLM
jgi:hypothetical protein